MITIHFLASTFVLHRMPGSAFDRHRWGIYGVKNPTVCLGWFKMITGPRGIGWWMASPFEVERHVVCEGCGNSGFSGFGTGYGDVCDECGGQSLQAGGVPVVPWWRFW